MSRNELLDLRQAAQLAAMRKEPLTLPPQVVLQLLDAVQSRPWEDGPPQTAYVPDVEPETPWEQD